MAHLVFQTAFPGDVFLSIPLIRRLRYFAPENEIVLACRPGLGDFFLHHKLVDRVISVDKKSSVGRSQALRELGHTPWDLILCPHASVRTALWMLRLSAGKGKVGFRTWWNGFIFNNRVEKPMLYPDALRQLSLMSAIDFKTAELFASPEIEELKSPIAQSARVDFRNTPIPSWASMQVVAHKPSSEKIIYLAPGSVWATKRWRQEGYEVLAGQLIELGYKVVLVGSGAERDLCQAIAKHVPGLISQAGDTTLTELVDLFSQGQALVCNDSGAMHAAAAAGLPTVAIFGPTVLRQGFRPWNDKSLVIQRQINCRPCGKHGAQLCPIGTHECMNISSDEVLKAVRELVGR